MRNMMAARLGSIAEYVNLTSKGGFVYDAVAQVD